MEANGYKETEIGMVPAEWEVVDFLDSLSQSKFVEKDHIPRSGYKISGKYPIVDQGSSLVAGFTDDGSLVHSDDLPVVIFGDHTRIFKYIDFPFVIGADGTKVLKSKATLFDPKFYYYTLLSLEIPSKGYNRHFKYLKEQIITAPPLSEQRTIAAILSKIQQAIETQERIIERTKKLKRALMAKLFTEGLHGEELKETEIGMMPKSWGVRSVDSLGEIVTGTTPPTADPENFGFEHPFITPVDLGPTKFIYKTQRYVSQKGLSLCRPLPRNSVLVTCIGSTIGKVGLTFVDKSVTNQQINAIIVSKDLHAQFLYYAFDYRSDYIRSLGTPSPVPILSKGKFGQALIGVPRSKNAQEEIAAPLSMLDLKIETTEKKCSALRLLFKSMLHQLMTGRMRVKDIEIANSASG